MTIAADLITRAQRMGATFEITAENVDVIWLEETLPSQFLEELRRHKAEIRTELIKTGYERCFPGPDQCDDEMAEMERLVKEKGYVLLWSNVLADLVAFHRDDVDPATIPSGFVPYSEEELCYLFPEDEHAMSENALRLIHKAKTMGARISGCREE
jgi:hypothetical protein